MRRMRFPRKVAIIGTATPPGTQNDAALRISRNAEFSQPSQIPRNAVLITAWHDCGPSAIISSTCATASSKSTTETGAGRIVMCRMIIGPEYVPFFLFPRAWV